MAAGLPIPSHQFFSLSRGKTVDFVPFCIGVARLPTDSIGNTTVTFLDVNAGSEIRVYLPDGSEAAGVESCDVDHVLSWPVYASGSANNVVRIVIVHPAYRIKEFSYTSSPGSQSIPMQQELDKWYSNPA